MTAAEVRKEYQNALDLITQMKSDLTEVRTRATELSNLYGRLSRDELRASQAKPAEEKS